MSEQSLVIRPPSSVVPFVDNSVKVLDSTDQMVRNFGQVILFQQNINNYFMDMSRTINIAEQKMDGLTEASEEAGNAVKNDLVGSLQNGLEKLNKWYQMLKSIGSVVLKAAAEEEDWKYRYMIAADDPDLGEGVYQKFRNQAFQGGQNVNDSLQSSLAFMPLAQNVGQVEQLNELTKRLSVLSPDGKSLTDASSALVSAMNGDNSNLASDFNVSESALDGAGLEDFTQTKDLDGFIGKMQTVLEMQGYTQEAFDTMLDSPLQKWTGIVNQFNAILAELGTKALEVLSPVLDRLSEAISSGQFSGLINWVGTAFALIAQVIAFIVDGFITFATVVQENWNIIAPILTAIALVLLVGIIIQLGVMIMQVYALAVGWLAVNWPILLVIAAITAVIYLLQLCGVSAGEMIGGVIGYFMMVYEHIKSIFASFVNYLMSIIEFIVNLFIDPAYAIQKLFVDVNLIVLQLLYNITKGVEDFAGFFADEINWLIGVINKVIPYLNKIFGTEWGGIELISDSNVHSMSNKIQGLMDDLEAKTPESDKDVIQLWRMDATADYGAAMTEGMDIGKSFDNTLKNLPGSADGLQNPFGDGFKPETPTVPTIPTTPTIPTVQMPNNNINKINNVGKVDQIGDVSGTVDVTSEDLKLMRELAEMQAIQRFVSLTPTVQVTTGDINSGHDIDSIITKITDGLNSQIVSSAQGVYG